MQLDTFTLFFFFIIYFLEICKQDPDSLFKFQNDTATFFITNINYNKLREQNNWPHIWGVWNTKNKFQHI